MHGQVFFASADAFATAFHFDEPVATVEIDLHHAHFWDISAVAALDEVVMKYRRQHTAVAITGMNEASATLIGALNMAPNRSSSYRPSGATPSTVNMSQGPLLEICRPSIDRSAARQP